MSVLDALDATRVCSRRSASLGDAAWARPVPTVARRVPAPVQRGRYSWWSLARNPHAMLVTGMVGTVWARDAVLRILEPSVDGQFR
jgi:hypothetical protein